MIELRSDMGVQLIQRMGDDHVIAHAAMVSTLADQSQKVPEGKTAGLINFLMKNRHGTPFEHNAMTFFVEAPIFVFREFMRHRVGFSYNEESGRYRQLRPIFYMPDADRNLIQVGKPGEYDFIPGSIQQLEAVKLNEEFAYEEAYRSYTKMLEAGVAREVARSVLPVGIYSSMYVTCNARSLMSFLSLRTKRKDSAFPSYPQREIEMVAEQMEAIFAQLFPVTYDAFNKNRRVSP